MKKYQIEMSETALGKTLTSGEKFKTMGDKSFIENHIAEIDEMYTSYISNMERNGKEIDRHSTILAAVNLVKVDEYFKLLYPEYETLTPDEKFKTMGDKSFIENHIAEIDEMYTSYISNMERNGKEIDRHSTILTVVDLVKEKLEEKEALTFQEIGKNVRKSFAQTPEKSTKVFETFEKEISENKQKDEKTQGET